MSGILVIGGYGGFGARLCRRLAAGGHRLLVGGRSEAKAERFCAGLDGAEPVAIDREGDVAAVLARHRPALVIDAAGPFQESSYRVPRACIEAGIPYLDLADGRSFVTGIGALSEAARAAGVAVLSGASSLPALSGAVARRLAAGMERVCAVEIALSASNRASGGVAVVRAILSYVGKPLSLWRGQRWTQVHGWQEMRRANFTFADGAGLRGRLVAIADVPDAETLPALLPGRPAVTFRAGTELGFQMRALWLASWLVRWRALPSLRPAAPLLVALYRLTRALGGSRSAMSVTMRGTTADARIERRWTLVAERGEGVEIPPLAAAILAGEILAGRIEPGARPADSALPLDRFEEAFAGLAVRHETAERALRPPLYAGVMGESFDALPPTMRAIHDFCADAGAAGEGTVRRGRGPLARLIAAAMGFPPEGVHPLHVAFAERGGAETWTRDFGRHRFSSQLSKAADGLLVERFGPLRFAFELAGKSGGLAMELRRWSFWGIPLPRLLGPKIAAREWEEEGRFRFEVAVAMPVAGDIVHYSGWLRPIA